MLEAICCNDDDTCSAAAACSVVGTRTYTLDNSRNLLDHSAKGGGERAKLIQVRDRQCCAQIPLSDRLSELDSAIDAVITASEKAEILALLR